MTQPIIEVDHLSKRYRLGVFNARSLREEAERLAQRIFEGRRGDGEGPRDFWALNNVSFTVRPGEVLGVVGRNGAGKSTLLKVLSRITEPTLGRAILRGRVASLLEVGTGFHPELTGRENIFLNGAILGMTRAEIAAKFDEIVAFAEIEQFLDTPVKRYSSGMYVRLAFAVAAHLEPEILIVDEVLAVGDTLFQQKCLGKMKSVSSQQGRTVLFVSHNMGLVHSLCSRALVMEHGKIAFDGETAAAVNFYQRDSFSSAQVDLASAQHRRGTGEARILSVRLEDDYGHPAASFRMGEGLSVIVRAEFQKEVTNPIFGFNIMTETGVMVADCRSSYGGPKVGRINGIIEFRGRIAPVHLYPRRYTLEPWLSDASDRAEYDWVYDAAQFEVTSGPKFYTGANVSSAHGIVHVPVSWSMQ